MIGASLVVADSTELALVQIGGMTLGTQVKNLDTDSYFELRASTAALGDTVVAVSGVTGLRWVESSEAILDLATLFGMRSDLLLPAGFAAKLDDLDTVTSLFTLAGSPVADATRGPGVTTFPDTNFTLLLGSTVIANPAVTGWHIGGRARLLTIASGNVKGFSLAEGSVASYLHVGLRESVSATKFVFSVSKAGVAVTALSTVDLDTTNFHVLEMFNDVNGVLGTAGNVYGSVDDETPVLVTTSANSPIVALTERHGIELASGGADGLLIDATYYAAGRTTT
jgi:hypothetical protein